MRAELNLHLFKTTIDSSSLNQLTAVSHRFSKSGVYQATIFRGGAIAGRFLLQVSDEWRPGPLTIDLATVPDLSPTTSAASEPRSRKRFVTNPDEYVIFYVSRGAGGYAVVITGANRGRSAVEFDSRELNRGDLFSVALFRPGTYAIDCVTANKRAEAIVSYPEIGDEPYVPPDPVQVTCTDSGFQPDNIRVKPGQTQMFNFTSSRPSQINVKLITPIDRPL